jgi:type II secretory pathway component PulK
MAQERSAILTGDGGQRGASLIMVLVALAALTPLALALSEFVLMRQRQATGHQQNIGGQAMVRGGLDLALAGLESKQIALGPGQRRDFDLGDSPRPVNVRVVRDDDSVLAMDGSVIAIEDAGELDIDGLAVDPTSGAVRKYRRLEVYSVEAESPARYPFAAVRLLAVVGRLDDRVFCLGVRYDRGYFP